MTDYGLTLMQWLSPAFPVGAFAYSHGLEQVIADGTVRDAQTLRQWLSDLLTHGSGRADAILLAAAYSTEDPSEIDATARAFAASAERLMETDLPGGAFCDTVRAVWGLPLQGLTYPGRRWMCGPRHRHTAGADTATLFASLCRQSNLGSAAHPSPWANRRATGAGGAFQHDFERRKRQQGGIP